jgi:hypothetical protein
LRQALFGAFTLKSFISFILPFGSIRNMDFYGTDLSMSNAYFGLLTLLFFFTGLMIKRPGMVNLFLFWGLFCLTASVGSILPVREFLYHYIPLMNLFRFPAIFRIFFILSFVIVAGFAFDEWRKGLQAADKKYRLITLTFGIVTGICCGCPFRKHLHIMDLETQLFIASKIDDHSAYTFQGIVQLAIILYPSLIKMEA